MWGRWVNGAGAGRGHPAAPRAASLGLPQFCWHPPLGVPGDGAAPSSTCNLPVRTPKLPALCSSRSCASSRDPWPPRPLLPRVPRTTGSRTQASPRQNNLLGGGQAGTRGCGVQRGWVGGGLPPIEPSGMGGLGKPRQWPCTSRHLAVGAGGSLRAQRAARSCLGMGGVHGKGRGVIQGWGTSSAGGDTGWGCSGGLEEGLGEAEGRGHVIRSWAGGWGLGAAKEQAGRQGRGPGGAELGVQEGTGVLGAGRGSPECSWGSPGSWGATRGAEQGKWRSPGAEP